MLTADDFNPSIVEDILVEDIFFPLDYPASIPLCELIPTYMEDLL